LTLARRLRRQMRSLREDPRPRVQFTPGARAFRADRAWRDETVEPIIEEPYSPGGSSPESSDLDAPARGGASACAPFSAQGPALLATIRSGGLLVTLRGDGVPPAGSDDDYGCAAALGTAGGVASRARPEAAAGPSSGSQQSPQGLTLSACESRLPKTPHMNAVRTALGSLDNAIDGVESPTVARSPEEDDSAAAAHRENIDPSPVGQRQSPGSALNELACLASIQHAARTAVEASSEFVAKLAPPASPGAGTSSAASTPVPASPSDGVTTANEPTGDAIV